MPLRTSPVPAVASAGLPPMLTPVSPSGSTTSVSSPFSTTTAPERCGRLAGRGQAVGLHVRRGPPEQAAELTRVRREDRRGIATGQYLETGLGQRVQAVGIDQQRLLDPLGEPLRKREAVRLPPQAGSQHDRIGPLGRLHHGVHRGERQRAVLVGQRHAHHLGQLHLEDRVQRGRHPDAHPPRARAHRPRRGQADRAGQARRASDDQHGAGAELRRPRAARRQPHGRPRADQAGGAGLGRAAPCHGDADVDRLDPPGMLLSRVHPEPDLRGMEGDGHVRPHARALDLAGGRVHPRGHVDRDDRRTRNR